MIFFLKKQYFAFPSRALDIILLTGLDVVLEHWVRSSLNTVCIYINSSGSGGFVFMTGFTSATKMFVKNVTLNVTFRNSH